MSRSARRRSDDRTESLIKATFALLLMVALAIGGLGGFTSVLLSLVVLVIVVVLFGGAAFLLVKSSLAANRKTGLLLILGGILGLLSWNTLKAPPVWPQVEFKVVSIHEPAAQTTAEYVYQDQGSKRSALKYALTLTKDWTSVAEAKRSGPNAITIYYNPQDPRQAAEKLSSGWLMTRATPGPVQIQEAGDYVARIQQGSLFNLQSLEIKGPAARDLKIGQAVMVWQNPLNPGEYSLVAQNTVGGNKWGLLVAAIVAFVSGIVCLFLRASPVDAPPTSQAGAAFRGESPSGPAESSERAASFKIVSKGIPPVLQKTTVSLLGAIDWYQFEKIAARILELEGWQVERRGGAKADGGADLLARKAGKSAVVQCKYWKSFMITPKTLRELLGTKVSSGFTTDFCILFSRSECTEAAKEFAQANAIIVYVADDVIGFIDRHGRDQFPELQNPDDKYCPRCDSPMVLRQGHSAFWGCSTYPRCRGKIEISADT